MYKQLNIYMDSIFIQLHISLTGKDISINKIRYYKSDNLCRHVYELKNRVLHLGLHHLNPTSLNSKLRKQWKAWEEHKVLHRDKGMQTQV